MSQDFTAITGAFAAVPSVLTNWITAAKLNEDTNYTITSLGTVMGGPYELLPESDVENPIVVSPTFAPYYILNAVAANKRTLKTPTQLLEYTGKVINYTVPLSEQEDAVYKSLTINLSIEGMPTTRRQEFDFYTKANGLKTQFENIYSYNNPVSGNPNILNLTTFEILNTNIDSFVTTLANFCEIPESNFNKPWFEQWRTAIVSGTTIAQETYITCQNNLKTSGLI